MTAVDDRAFRKALATRSFQRAYALYGEEELLKAQALRDLIDAAIDPATRDFNLDVRDAAALDAETLGSFLGTPPMMADRRMVVVRDAPALRKDARGVVDRFLAADSGAGSPDIILVLVYPAGEKGKPDRSVLDHTFATDFGPLASERVPRWIVHHAATAHATTVTPEAAQLLHRVVGGDLAALAAELDKLASYTSGAPVDERAVSDVVGVRHGETMGDFLDLVARRDAGAALALLPHILEQPKVTAVTLVMALTTQTLALAWGRSRIERGVSPARLEREYYDFLKGLGGAYTGRPWGEAVRAWTAVVDRWDDAALDAALEALLAADITLKDTRVSGDEQIMATLTLALCATAARGGAANRAA